MAERKPICLIVENQRDWIEIVRDRLTVLGVEVTVAQDHADAISRLEDKRYDLIVLDLSLDHENDFRRGFDVLRWIDRNLSKPIPVIVVSGTKDFGDIMELFNQHSRVVYFASKADFHTTSVITGFDEAVRSAIRGPIFRRDDGDTDPIKVFVSKSFDPQDEAINTRFESVLDSLGVKYITGESYSAGSIPEKIEGRILESRTVVAICVSEIVDGKRQALPPPWIVREVSFAEARDRRPIILSERGVSTPWPMDHELILFNREDESDLTQATNKFLSALVAHGLIRIL